MTANAHGGIAREEQVRQWRQLVAELVQRSCQRPWGLDASLDEHRDERRRRQRLDLARERLTRDDVQGFTDQELACLLVGKHVGQQGAHLVHGAEPLQHGSEPLVLPARLLGVRQVVVQIVLARRRRHAQQLRTRCVDDDRPQTADLRGHVDCHDPKITRRFPSCVNGMRMHHKVLAQSSARARWCPPKRHISL